jgi:hypothetical protein
MAMHTVMPANSTARPEVLSALPIDSSTLMPAGLSGRGRAAQQLAGRRGQMRVGVGRKAVDDLAHPNLIGSALAPARPRAVLGRRRRGELQQQVDGPRGLCRTNATLVKERQLRLPQIQGVRAARTSGQGRPGQYGIPVEHLDVGGQQRQEPLAP